MPSKGGVIRFNIELKVILQAVVVEKAHDGLRVVVVLMLGWLARLGLDQQLRKLPLDVS